MMLSITATSGRERNQPDLRALIFFAVYFLSDQQISDKLFMFLTGHLAITRRVYFTLTAVCISSAA